MNAILRGKIALVTGGGRKDRRRDRAGPGGEGAAVAVTYPDRAPDAGSRRRLLRVAGGPLPCRAMSPMGPKPSPQSPVRSGAWAAWISLSTMPAYSSNGRFSKMPVSEFDRVIAVNLRGAFITGQAAIRHMNATGGGRIINIASDLAYFGREQFSAYCASKAGILSASPRAGPGNSRRISW